MSTIIQNKLIGRLKRVALGGRGNGFEKVISDLMRAICAGELTDSEFKAVLRVADDKLRRNARTLRAQKIIF